MKKYQDISILLLRIAMAVTFLSAVASRLNLWGKQSSGWNGFLSYTAEVLSFMPYSMISLCAIASTVLEILFALMLITGFKLKIASLGAACLTLSFALSMAYSYGVKSPLDYSVFTDSAACFALATFPSCRWSIDMWLVKRKLRIGINTRTIT
ncbi:DoxX family protein [Panacibacter ginsenosidivorans]|uniref:DoxX family protein n=1 Tax=Panacibacter ginsenosidivorans TaxID=1813871 RepID=A0A5B8V5L0_9BACT|nr:DoxX family protein [Panacibacter ginsenosidivorans]QEC66502.1 DoxX family protein [Panacibacter ginsenosidivorans]